MQNEALFVQRMNAGKDRYEFVSFSPTVSP